MKFNPHDYQVQGVKHLLKNPNAGLVFDMGMGKSATVLTVIDELLLNFDVKAALIVAPLRVARITWPLEIAQWDHTNWMQYAVVHGPKKEEILWGPQKHIYLINYEGLIWLAHQLKNRRDWPFDMIVWDESTRMKNPSSQRYKIWKHGIKFFKRRVALTGTPAPNGHMDLYGQCYMVDEGERLGKSFYRFRDKYFYVDYSGYNYTLRDDAAAMIENEISDIFLSIKNPHKHIPYYETVDVTLPTKLKKQYKALEKSFITKIGETDLITATTAATLSGKCLQFTSGNAYDSEGQVVEIHTEKVKAIKALQKKHKGKNILVAYGYRHEADMYERHFPEATIWRSGQNMAKQQGFVKDWNDGKIPLLFAHPQSIGHGLNLQFGGHIIIWPTLTWNLELWEQFNARLARQGQTDTVLIYKIIMKDTIDEVVDVSLNRKTKVQESIIDILELYKK